jgi:hypothetical protein
MESFVTIRRLGPPGLVRDRYRVVLTNASGQKTLGYTREKWQADRLAQSEARRLGITVKKLSARNDRLQRHSSQVA